ncbi:T9SS type A sorting domain-containing protein [candidate division KSB1 bacterium]|nr:T9SS type A sorting domain-containing protein [candidate division KSB1 bacterium]
MVWLNDGTGIDIGDPFTIQPAVGNCALNVIGPGWGDEWRAAPFAEAWFEWSYSGNCTGTISADLYKHGSPVRNMATGLPVTDLSYAWEVTSDIRPDWGYQILIKSDADSNIRDLGAPFTVMPPYGNCALNVVGPGWGDEWRVDWTGEVVEWGYSGNCSGTVRVDLYRNGNLVRNINPGVNVANRTCTWDVPDDVTPGYGYQIFVYYANNDSICSMGAPFYMAPPLAICALSVIGPGYGDEWRVGYLNETVEWAFTGDCVGQVDVELRRAGSFILALGTYPVTDLQCSIDLPMNGLEPGYGYEIFLRHATVPRITAHGNPFNMMPMEGGCEVLVTDPGYGDALRIGQMDTIRWTYSGSCTGTIRLDLYRNGGFDRSIAESVPVSTLSYAWQVPNDLSSGVGYSVRLRGTGDLLLTERTVSNMSEPCVVQGGAGSCIITTTSPGVGTIWQTGQSVNIEWNLEGSCSGDARIDLLRGGGLVYAIAQSVSLTGQQFQWTVPQHLVSSSEYQVRVQSTSNPSFVSISQTFQLQQTVDVPNEAAGGVPDEYSLEQNFPNPFNPSTTIRFGVPMASEVIIEVFDVLGRKVETLRNGLVQPGVYSVVWNCSTCSSGLYFVQMQTRDKVALKKMLLLN